MFVFGQQSEAQDNKTEEPKSTKPAGQPENPAMAPVALYNLLQSKSIVFPDISTTTEPLTVGDKFKLSVDNSISVHTITWAALGAAVGQADNSPTGWDQGWDAYAKRFGSSMARQASGEFFGTFILASALHEDPRFFPEINPTFGHSVKYSIARVFITRSDDGRNVKNFSGLIGPLMGEALANTYYPDRNRTVGDTFLRYGLDLATKAGGNMMREYWPVLYAKMKHTQSSPRAH